MIALTAVTPSGHDGPMDTTRTADGRAARLAARRHGLITLPQALAVGLTTDQIQHRTRTGRWEIVGRAVYRIAGAPASTHQEGLAAVLSAGPTALVSHQSALALVGVGSPSAMPHLTVAPTASARTPRVVLHRSAVPFVDRSSVGCIPTTTPARSLVDSASLVDRHQLAELVDGVICGGLAQPSAILGAARRSQAQPGRKGVPLLRSVLGPWFQGIQPGSPAEVRLLRRLDDWGFPAPISQVRVRSEAGEVIAAIDLGWPGRKVGLEYDGEQAHSPRHLASDIAREERLRALGWRIERVDKHDLRPSSTRLRDLLMSLLYARAA